MEIFQLLLNQPCRSADVWAQHVLVYFLQLICTLLIVYHNALPTSLKI